MERDAGGERAKDKTRKEKRAAPPCLVGRGGAPTPRIRRECGERGGIEGTKWRREDEDSESRVGKRGRGRVRRPGPRCVLGPSLVRIDEQNV